MRKYCKINFIFSKEVCIFLKKNCHSNGLASLIKDMLCG